MCVFKNSVLITDYWNIFIIGSEGKLTVWKDRTTILESIGKLEGNSIGNSSSMEGLVKTVIDKTVPYIQQEGMTVAFVVKLIVQKINRAIKV